MFKAATEKWCYKLCTYKVATWPTKSHTFTQIYLNLKILRIEACTSKLFLLLYILFSFADS